MHTGSLQARRGFLEAASFLVETIEAVPEDRWDAPGLGEWTVRELAVHACRAFSTTIAYVAAEAPLTLDHPAAYYEAALGGGVEAGDLHRAVADRARAEAADLEVPVAQHARALFRRAELVLERTPASHVVGTFAGGIRLVDYLPTRVVEMVVHGIDICDALGLPVDVPLTAAEMTLDVLMDLAVSRSDADAPGLVRALTGRAGLPAAFNLLG